MTQSNQMVKSAADKHVKAEKILTLTEELHDMTAKRKSVAAAFTTRIKEIKQDIADVLKDEQTAGEIVAGVSDVHDLEVIK